ncbi:hypothetical protein LEN26_008317 [Aphanomyces euteiches]|nr:hypothetical protein LEN26_008317 [Aphanomyces euteiches]
MQSPSRWTTARHTLFPLMIVTILFGFAVAATAVHVDIFNGEGVPPSMFPEYIALLVDDPRKQIWRCTGSLIAPSFVLTAAHCVDDIAWVYLGANDASGNGAKQQFKVTGRFVHPKYNTTFPTYDVGLLKLSDAAKLTPATVHWDEDQYNAPGSTAWIRGYGRISTDGPRAETLLQAQVPILPIEICSKALHGVDPVSMICAGGSKNDTCVGDSGGPLTVVKDGKEVLVGVTSWGDTICGRSIPSLYARLSVAKAFVASILSPPPPPPPRECIERPKLK